MVSTGLARLVDIGVGIVHGVWVDGCVGIMLAPQACQHVHWCCKRTTICRYTIDQTSLVKWVPLLRRRRKAEVKNNYQHPSKRS